MGLAIQQILKLLWSKDERAFIRNRITRSWSKQASQLKESAKSSEVTDMFRSAGLSWITNIRWLIFRFSLVVIGAVIFLFNEDTTTALIYVVLMQLLTEPTWKFSGIQMLLKARIKQIRRQKENELFSLFSLLKTDLISSQTSQINVYHLVKSSLPYFHSIKPVMILFLNQWKKSPELAGEVFEKELGGETAQFVGDILARLHNMSRKDAIHLLTEQNKVFAYERSERSMQQAEVQRNFYWLFFFSSASLTIVWFMIFIFNITLKALNF